MVDYIGQEFGLFIEMKISASPILTLISHLVISNLGKVTKTVELS